MRLLSAALGVFLLLALLTWLLLRGIDTNAPAYAVTLQAFDDFALAEASLHRDVLQARAGLLRNYDTFAIAMEAMEDAVARLRSHAQAERLDGGPVDRLAATVAQQEELTERFKSSNALLQNSLSYVGLLSTSPAFAAQDAQLAPATGAMAAALLHLRRDASPDAVSALQERIDRFAAQAPTVGPDAEAARALLAHARLLQDLVPGVDETLKNIVVAPSRQPLEEIRALFAQRRSAVEATAQRFRLLLYLVSLLLLVILVHLGLRLRARALALRRRAAFEHVIAENSTRLINCPPAETDARLKQVLVELCRVIGVERAYAVLDENPIRVHAWSADGTAYPPGWPNQALAPVRAARRGRARYRHRARRLRLAARRSEGHARSRWRPRLGLCAADPSGSTGRHHGVRRVAADMGQRFPATHATACRRRSGQRHRARISRARPGEAHDAAGARAPHANDRIAGKRNCA